MTNLRSYSLKEVSKPHFSINYLFGIRQAVTIVGKHFIQGYKNAARVHRRVLSQDCVDRDRHIAEAILCTGRARFMLNSINSGEGKSH